MVVGIRPAANWGPNFQSPVIQNVTQGTTQHEEFILGIYRRLECKLSTSLAENVGNVSLRQVAGRGDHHDRRRVVQLASLAQELVG